jgi:hypothetical protein
MSRFVEECQKEWSRLGVPEATANEMAGDLEADLAEAQADGVSPEEVLGNGYFDARSFAASWAEERGLVTATRDTRTPATTYLRVRSLLLAVSTVACLVVGAMGLAILAGRRMSSMSVAAVSFPRPVPRPVTGLFVGPNRLGLLGGGAPLDALGLLLLVVGLLGAAVTLWIWKPWSTQSNRREPEPQMGLPTYF